jgi:hypothetical protein
MKARDPTSWHKRTHVCLMFTTTSAEQDSQITGRFDLKKIARVAELLWVESEIMGRNTEHNGEEQSDIDSRFLSRTNADLESEEMYSFRRCSDDEENWDIQIWAARGCFKRNDHYE